MSVQDHEFHLRISKERRPSPRGWHFRTDPLVSDQGGSGRCFGDLATGICREPYFLYKAIAPRPSWFDLYSSVLPESKGSSRRSELRILPTLLPRLRFANDWYSHGRCELGEGQNWIMPMPVHQIYSHRRTPHL